MNRSLNKKVLPNIPSLIVLLAAIGAFAAHLVLWRLLDWGQGYLRFVLIITLAGLTGVLWHYSHRLELSLKGPSAHRATWLLVVLCMAAISANVMTASSALRHVHTNDEILLDQGRINYRAVNYLRSGVNPYATDTTLEEPVVFENFQLYREHECTTWPAGYPGNEQAFKAQIFDPYWSSMEPDRSGQVRPQSIDNTDKCRPVHDAYKRLALKYAPVTLAIYTPFVLMADKAGIYWAHLFLVAALACVLVYSVNRYCENPGLIGTAVLVGLLAPDTIRWNTLWLTASDLPATLFGFLAVVLLGKGKRDASAVMIGLACASKLMPGLIYLPLLLAMRPRQWLLFALAFGLPLLPFVLWDAEGVFQNLFLFNLVRPTDSTALFHFLPEAAHLPIRLLALVALLGTVLWAHRTRWTLDATLLYLLVGHLLVWSVGGIFHNNYQLWIIPLYLLFIGRMLSPNKEGYPAVDSGRQG